MFWPNVKRVQQIDQIKEKDPKFLAGFQTCSCSKLSQSPLQIKTSKMPSILVLFWPNTFISTQLIHRYLGHFSISSIQCLSFFIFIFSNNNNMRWTLVDRALHIFHLFVFFFFFLFHGWQIGNEGKYR